ncbi:organic hydroperoxide resistance protein [Actinoplanes regularis]|uniref:Peroxiredoxin, Ohr subfamily n=1 Tax=Actinoplanes regularis TaxID=52697 RepID=A0A239BSR8_9ACTN|nr:organic hydroperoxide resistance protein [Actinoplanes regularis]GIE88318.1 organic hydroperoxide resistance protein [Actinoplanes regularis]SNS10692.1 peroxiredoxin, Ohr subfamily [Actinoplanes regularis]
MTALYTASATATGDGRNGHVRSSDGVLDFDLAIPKELGGAGGALTNPEQLFAAGYAACFHSALKRVASAQKVTLTDTAITIDVGLVQLPSGGFGLNVSIEAELPGLPEEQAKALLEAAHQLCPYSNATRGNVEVNLTLA